MAVCIARMAIACSLWTALVVPGTAIRADEKRQDAEFFRAQVAPILVGRCLECHGDAKKGDLDLRTRPTALAGGESGAAIVPGKPGESLLFDHVSSGEMPPKAKDRLSRDQVAVLGRWIDDGAYFPKDPLDPLALTTDRRAGYDWWAFAPLGDIQPPDVEGSSDAWKRNAIDRFVLARLKANGLSPSSPADPRTLIRRVTYDLTGLPPSPREVEQFLSQCAKETGQADRVGEKSYEALVDRLLASPRYGEQWGRHWLDVVRFGESNGFERNVIITNAWPFRDYVIRSFNDDKPFDRLVLEHLAGDVVGPGDPEVEVGTTFLVCGPYDNVGNQDPVQARQIRANTVDEMVRATSEAFLGITVGCSRCHDHKFDPIAQRDYYSLYATFAGVQHGERNVPSPGSEQRRQRAVELADQIASVEHKLQAFEPLAIAGRTIALDEEAAQNNDPATRGVTRLRTAAGSGANPAGSQRGYRDDPGDVDRSANLSGGRYLWWQDPPSNEELFTWNVAAEGRFRVWLSWGCGWPSHTTDAKYLLDRDGDLATVDDQQLIATVDQQHFSGGGPGALPKVPLWSGLLDAGIHKFGPRSRIVLRSGTTGTAVTADVVVLQEVLEKEATGNRAAATKLPSNQPRLRPSVDPRRNVDRFAPVRARFVRFSIDATNASEPCLDELEVFTTADEGKTSRNVALASAGAKATSSGDYVGNPIHRLAHLNDGQYGNSRSWISNQLGQGWVQIELPQVETIDRIVWGRDRRKEFTDRLATSYQIEVAEAPGQWRLVASSADRLAFRPDAPSGTGYLLTGLSDDQLAQARPLVQRLQSLRQQAAEIAATKNQKWWIGNYSQANGPFHVFLGGSPERKGAEVVPASLSTLARATDGYELKSNGPESQRRLALARWIVAADNPLTPRVLANRLWHYHFGTGLVDTPSDFGFMGGRPTHPELLDWLARQLHVHGWRLKSLHKTIVLSQTYRQADTWRAEAAKVDGDSRLLWRFPPRRLAGEEIRDTLLTVAGKLDPTPGGPGFRLFQYVQDNVATYVPLDEHGPETYRRAVYHHNARAMRIDLMTEFDTPDCAFSTPRRTSTTTPLQALSLLNHSFTIDMARFLAERIEREADGKGTAAQVQRAFAIAYAREPSPEESSAAVKLVDQYGLRALCRAILNSNELIYVN